MAPRRLSAFDPTTCSFQTSKRSESISLKRDKNPLKPLSEIKKSTSRRIFPAESGQGRGRNSSLSLSTCSFQARRLHKTHHKTIPVFVPISEQIETQKLHVVPPWARPKEAGASPPLQGLGKTSQGPHRRAQGGLLPPSRDQIWPKSGLNLIQKWISFLKPKIYPKMP